MTIVVYSFFIIFQIFD